MHTDHLGSVRAVTDKAGTVVWSADYLAFGTRFGEAGDGSFEQWKGFTGKEYDPETGLYYFNARWYDQGIGRFISEDPARDPNNPNLYTYCANNPLIRIDPSGELWEWFKGLFEYNEDFTIKDDIKLGLDNTFNVLFLGMPNFVREEAVKYHQQLEEEGL